MKIKGMGVSSRVSLVRFRFLEPGSVTLALRPQENLYVLCFANGEQTVFRQGFTASPAQPVAARVNYRTT